MANWTTFFAFSPSTPCATLSSNKFTAMRSKQLMVLGMLANLWIIPIPFFHINPNILWVFLRLACLAKESYLTNNTLFFPSTSLQILHLIMCRLPYDLTHHFAQGSLAT
jgi:hypothetical protein